MISHPIDMYIIVINIYHNLNSNIISGIIKDLLDTYVF